MMRASVVRHKIDQHLHAEFVSVSNQILVVAHGSHVIVERVEVHHVIAVVIRIGVLPDRRQPQRSNAKIVQVSEMLANAAQVAAMIGHGITAIVFACGLRRLVVAGIAIGKTVGHDQIDHIVAGKTFKPAVRIHPRQ